MNISKFFIDRPIFAGVLSIMIFLAGLISIPQLPISEYPEVSPPSIVVQATFPGASPKVIAESVATPLEEQINGVENMLYMQSQATSNGVLKITVTFKIGTDADLAQQQVQNRVSQALPRLPEEVRNLGVITIKSSPDLTMVVHILSPDNRYDTLYLRNYAVLNIKDNLSRISGVGQVNIFGGGDYAMRVWLNPLKIAEKNLTAQDVINAIREQNVQVAAGTIGAYPASSDIDLQFTVNAHGRLRTVDEFNDIIIKVNDDGGVTHLRDVARVELSASDYTLESFLDNKPATALGIFQAPDSNSIEISDQVRETMKKLKESMPEGVDYDIVYDPTTFVRSSIKAVIHTLLEAVALVVIVVIVFLQTWRASVIPLLAVPISIIGTFALLHMFGFSINVLSLFGLVLAIGIVVDDAIVVVENVERNIESGLSPRDATYKAMREVSGPIIAITLTLCAVFIPIAFVSGLTGQFYKQFALTIAISTVISAINSLTLSPALSALLLKSHDAPKDMLTRGMDKTFGWFFHRFNNFFSRSSVGYSKTIVKVITHKSIAVSVYFVLIIITFFFFKLVPPGFVPAQDKQYLIGFAQLQEGATLDRTKEVIKKMSEIGMNEPGVSHSVAFPGLSINGFSTSSSAGIVFMPLKPFEERGSDQSAFALSQRLNQKFAGISDAFIAIFPPPPVRGLGTTGGFKLQIEDRGDRGYEELDRVTKEILMKAWQTPALSQVYSSYKINVPQLEAVLDREKAKQLGLNIRDIFETMQIYLGSLYINDFNEFGRTYRVMAQADTDFRSHKEDIIGLKARNDKGEMIPLGTVLNVKESYGSESSIRYNTYLSSDINGSPAPGFSSGQAENAMIKILDETLPKGMTYEWTDLKYQQILAGNTTLLVFPLCVFLVFLVLSAKYESLALPFAVILIVPMCVLSAILGVYLWGGDNNIFTQISLFVLIGLACKNAILIVEFAHELELHHGRSTVKAAIEACKLRLRPILMTSFAFIMGVTPLVISSGAGSEMRQAMGVAVFSGMLGVTFFGLFLTPVFYVILRKLADIFIGDSKNLKRLPKP